MIRYILYICIVLFLTYIGYFLSGKYRQAKHFYISWESFHKLFLSESAYVRRPLGEVINSFKRNDLFSEFLSEYQTTHEVTEKVDCLTKEENDFLREYFSFLGKSDYSAQKEYFSQASQRLAENRQKSEEKAAKYTDLYIKLGFLLGLAIIILLV